MIELNWCIFFLLYVLLRGAVISISGTAVYFMVYLESMLGDLKWIIISERRTCARCALEVTPPRQPRGAPAGRRRGLQDSAKSEALAEPKGN